MSLYWEEDEETGYQVPDDIVDVAFRLSCRCLPLDHAAALSQALCERLPWLASEEGAGVHLIHGPASGNGWTRPQDPSSEVLYLSRRTRMTLRLPKERVDEARRISGATLELKGYPLTLGETSIRPLSALPTLFARYVVSSREETEGDFLEAATSEMRGMGVRARKVMCGKSAVINTPEGELFTRSVMVADLEPHESVILQQRGLGPMRVLGCGLFVGHKGIRPVDEAASHASAAPRF